MTLFEQLILGDIVDTPATKNIYYFLLSSDITHLSECCKTLSNLRYYLHTITFNCSLNKIRLIPYTRAHLSEKLKKQHAVENVELSSTFLLPTIIRNAPNVRSIKIESPLRLYSDSFSYSDVYKGKCSKLEELIVKKGPPAVWCNFVVSLTKLRPQLLKLQLYNCQINDQYIKLIFEKVQQLSLVHLDLTLNQITPVGVFYLASAIKCLRVPKLQVCKLSFNPIKTGWITLADALSSGTPHLKQIEGINSGIDNDCICALASLMGHLVNFENIHISVGIGKQCPANITPLVLGIRRHSSLRIFDIRGFVHSSGIDVFYQNIYNWKYLERSFLCSCDGVLTRSLDTLRKHVSGMMLLREIEIPVNLEDVETVTHILYYSYVTDVILLVTSSCLPSSEYVATYQMLFRKKNKRINFVLMRHRLS